LPAKAWASVLGSSDSVVHPPHNAAAIADATEIRATAAETLGERWEEKAARIRKKSKFGKDPAWDLRTVIVKSGDDCRQEHLAAQLVSHFAGEGTCATGARCILYPRDPVNHIFKSPGVCKERLSGCDQVQVYASEAIGGV
jgi:hypothetical protein